MPKRYLCQRMLSYNSIGGSRGLGGGISCLFYSFQPLRSLLNSLEYPIPPWSALFAACLGISSLSAPLFRFAGKKNPVAPLFSSSCLLTRFFCYYFVFFLPFLLSSNILFSLFLPNHLLRRYRYTHRHGLPERVRLTVDTCRIFLPTPTCTTTLLRRPLPAASQPTTNQQ